MGKSRKKKRNNADTPGQFAALPYSVIRSEAFQNCKPIGIHLLLTLMLQYKGDNNGDICVSPKVMKEYGWHDKRQLGLGLTSLLDSKLMIKTRQGGKNQCSLFAFSWIRIHDCFDQGRHKLDVAATDKAPVKFS